MTTIRMPMSGPVRRAAVVVLAAAGVALSPLPALANTGTTTAAVAAAPAAAPTQAAQVAVDTALAQQGKPYVWGGAGPKSYDCSGLMQYAYAAAGICAAALVQHAVDDRAPRWPTAICSPVTWSSSTRRSATSACTSATARWSTPRPTGQPVKVIDLAYMPGFNSARRIA